MRVKENDCIRFVRCLRYIALVAGTLDGSTADEEPLVDGGVDLLGGQLLVGGEGRQLVGSDAAW